MDHDLPPPYRTVVFDCDSTLSAIEGIDELARAHRVDVTRLTERAMQGELSLESVYKQRLEMIHPSRAAIERIGELYVEQVLPHARELCAALRHLKKRVCIVSGGIAPAVLRLARELEVEPRDVFAVPIHHDRDGRYAGFDEASPLAKSGGKVEVVARLERESAPLVLIGDGITDLEAAPHAARFIAFAGVARREAVLSRSRVRCEVGDLAALVPLLFSATEIDHLAQTRDHAALVRSARALA